MIVTEFAQLGADCCKALTVYSMHAVAHRWQPLATQKQVPLLLACGIDGSVPGVYDLMFSVTNSAGMTAAVTRQLTVKALCPEGEQLCADKV